LTFPSRERKKTRLTIERGIGVATTTPPLNKKQHEKEVNHHGKGGVSIDNWLGTQQLQPSEGLLFGENAVNFGTVGRRRKKGNKVG